MMQTVDLGPKVISLPSLSSKSVSPIFVELDLSHSEATRGKFICSKLGSISVVRSQTTGNAFQIYRSKELIQKSAHDNLFICIPVAGKINLNHNNYSSSIGKGEIIILDSSRWYSIDMPESSDVFWLNVPRSKLGTRQTAINKIYGQSIYCSEGLGHVTLDFISSICRQLSYISDSEAESLTNNLIDLLSLTINSIFTESVISTSHCDRKLQLIQRYIENHLHEPNLSLKVLSEEFNISTRYICKLFEPEGVTPSKWISKRRLEQCYQMLKNPSYKTTSIAEIAYMNGFNNICNFNKLFKDTYKHPPKMLRIH